MALSVSEVYYLSGETLRQACLERCLDHSGPVRELRQRLAEHIRSGPIDPPEVRQVSATTDLGNNTGTDIPPIVPSGSHGSGGEGAVPVLVELLRPVPPLSSEEPEAIMRLLIRLDAVHDLGMFDDRTFIVRILSLVSGSVLTFWGDSLRVGRDWAECMSHVLF